ncbi:unnamed protein product [Heligmosomoides polygyrus]|uniref:Uncharacterized protein n=1 Tax=Heligmosomoides polygyrus TaxID=6339 RepID=A0A183G0I9_HELPZ|nr:unnamed protein product [Heligmosomoides polygyrus]
MDVTGRCSSGALLRIDDSSGRRDGAIVQWNATTPQVTLTKFHKKRRARDVVFGRVFRPTGLRQKTSVPIPSLKNRPTNGAASRLT